MSENFDSALTYTSYLAVDELLNWKNVTVSKSESFGCRIFYRGEKQKMN